MNNYDVWEKPTEHMKLDAEKAWFWALRLLYIMVIPMVVGFGIAFALSLPFWSHPGYFAGILCAVFVIGWIFSEGFGLPIQALLAISYGIAAIVKRQAKLGTAILSIFIGLIALSGPFLSLFLLAF